MPNKEFVTKQVINWSLSDTVTRIDIAVGIAYGANVDEALAKLLEVARAHEHVLEEPKPRALFLGFGATSLSLELRVFSPDVEHTLSIRHDLHVAIERAFREAEIPFVPPPAPAALRRPRPRRRARHRRADSLDPRCSRYAEDSGHDRIEVDREVEQDREVAEQQRGNRPQGGRERAPVQVDDQQREQQAEIEVRSDLPAPVSSASFATL